MSQQYRWNRWMLNWSLHKEQNFHNCFQCSMRRSGLLINVQTWEDLCIGCLCAYCPKIKFWYLVRAKSNTYLTSFLFFALCSVKSLERIRRSSVLKSNLTNLPSCAVNRGMGWVTGVVTSNSTRSKWATIPHKHSQICLSVLIVWIIRWSVWSSKLSSCQFRWFIIWNLTRSFLAHCNSKQKINHKHVHFFKVCFLLCFQGSILKFCVMIWRPKTS